MPDRHDIPDLGPDPMDEAYLRAEHVLDDEARRMARRARVLAAVAQEPAAPALPARRPVRRYGGWLAAACVAGLSVWTAQRVYRSAPPPQQSAPQGLPPAVTPSAPAVPTSPAPTVQPPALRAPPRIPVARPPVAAHREAEVADAPVQAQPPPLPIPPVDKPVPPPPAPIASLSAAAPAPAPMAAAKAGAAEPATNSTLQSVVVTGSRIARRDYAASSPAIS